MSLSLSTDVAVAVTVQCSQSDAIGNCHPILSAVHRPVSLITYLILPLASLSLA